MFESDHTVTLIHLLQVTVENFLRVLTGTVWTADTLERQQYAPVTVQS